MPAEPDLTRRRFLLASLAAALAACAERIDPTSGVPAACDCSISGCDTESGGGEPDFVTASIPNGYPMLPVIPGVTLPNGPILLKPTVRVPFGGT